MSDEDDMIYCGRITFDVAVPLSLLEPETATQLTFFPVVPLYTDSPQGRALAGVRGADEEDGWAPSFAWFNVRGVLEAIARRHRRALETDATFDSDQRGRGRLVVDAGGRFHDCREDEQPDRHRLRACRCFPVPADSPTLFAVADVTDDERITVQPMPAGPFTDYAVVCADHGDVACPTSEKEAVFRREAHIIEAHTTHPLPLGRTGAERALPPLVLDPLRAAAGELRTSRSYAAALAIRHRDAAREHVRQARAELRDLSHAAATEVLLCLADYVAELLADARPEA
ncbi:MULTISPECIES: hypothetical protein [unclassified Streptomyces]|uniref:hypothetical protein n=1 Tax=unclassified Streptomyces TaxID=2593676 RepID=UPI00081F6A96|nr:MULTISPECIES: hypothetical protein [unclassified Streptomyces]MYZ37919.1 hypothetical protein [Streptomyces sp. SID4917]SCF95163.1 hypothetical protein GA0115259_105477 [Streptomyces sp. MnatMP-M17]